MNALIVTCHPYDRSFTYAVAESVKDGLNDAGARVVRLDLYDEEFDPVLSGTELARKFSLDPQVQRYTERVREADHFAFVHPDWWSSPPALLKGWIERVFRPGIAYEWEGEEFQEKHHVPLLTGKSASIFVTTDRAEEEAAKSLRAFWSDFCEYSGITLRTLRLFTDLRHSSIRQRRAWLRETREHAQTLAAAMPGDSGSEEAHQ